VTTSTGPSTETTSAIHLSDWKRSLGTSSERYRHSVAADKVYGDSLLHQMFQAAGNKLAAIQTLDTNGNRD